jgi:NADPH-dependent ferric siderophore reductase
MVKRQVSAHRRPLRATVRNRRQVTPHLSRLTIGGPELAELELSGRDQWVRLFFPRRTQSQLRLPTWTGTGALLQLLTMDAATRPWVRSYSIRHARPDKNEVDLDIVTHGDGSPGSTFGLTARPGDPVAVLDEGVTFLPPVPGRRLLVADDSAVPAALSILDGADEQDRFFVLLEVGSPEDAQPLSYGPGVEVRWLTGRHPGAVPGQLALEALRSLGSGFKPDYAWVAGESGLVTAARRHLVNERSVPRGQISFVGYWKDGRASAG